MKMPQISAVATLLKPITWFPPMWAFACGAISSGASIGANWHIMLIGLVLTGPLVCASSQATNDWFDRHVDAINEPNRPIPSGRIPGHWGLYIAIAWSALSLLLASTLGHWGFIATIIALLLAWAYSMPPVRLKQNGWWGNLACGLSYEGLAWITGAALLAGGTSPSMYSLTFAILYSFSAHGIMTLNDFKAIEGDRKMGVRSLPVQLGVDRAARLACWVMMVPQVLVLILLLYWDRSNYALGIAALLLGQLVLMRRFLADPVRHALFYSGFGVPLLVSGMMVSAFAIQDLGSR